MENKPIEQHDAPTKDSLLLQTPQIELPKGGGAIKSIDEKFMVNAVNGTSSCSVPLPFSAARGFSPSLALTYSSGGGNGVFGIGWSLSLPSIKRKTDKELPRYFDDSDSDTYIIAGAEDLVPLYKTDNNGALIQDQDGNYIIDGTDSPDTLFRIRPYRPRIEGSFSRIERWTEKATGYIHWRVISKDNATSLYGLTPATRIADPADDKKIFEWLPEFTFDDKGNCAKYEYKSEDQTGIGTSFLYNRNRLNGNAPLTNSYLKRVWYGNILPYKNPGDPLPDRFMFENVFDYGEHDATVLPFNETGPWSFRSDAFSTYKPGFEIRTCRLCRRVLLYHHFAELPGGSSMVKSLQLTYDNNGEDGFTFLKEATLTAYTKHDDSTYTQKSLPPLSYSYSALAWDSTVKSPALEDLANVPAGIDNVSYLFIDLYSEGLSGILTEETGGWYYKSNLQEGHFAPATLVMTKPSFTGLRQNWQITELEADGIKQMVNRQLAPRGYFELSDGEEWQPFQPFESMPNIDFRDPYTRLLDLDGDGMADVLITDQDVFTWYPSKGKKGFGDRTRVPNTPDEERNPSIIFADQIQSIFLADMSGDGLTDIVRIRNGEVCYWPNLGYGRFGARVAMDNAPVFDHDELFTPSLIKLADIDGSGTADIVYLGQNQVRIWLNQQGNTFLPQPKTIPFFPETETITTIDIVDLLGTGLSCIVWSSPLPKDQSSSLRYIDLMNSTKPHILSGYKNNMGKEVQLEYTPSTRFYLEDKRNGTPWITKLHFPVHCVSKTIVYDRIMKTRFASEYSYHHGYYDHFEKEFRGFGRVDQKDSEDIAHFILQGGVNTLVEQDLHQPPILTKSWFHTGAFLNGEKILAGYEQEYFKNSIVPENPLPGTILNSDLDAEGCRQAIRACKGLLLRKEIYALDGPALQDKPYSAERHSYMVRILQPVGTNKYGVFLSHESESITYQYERDPGDPRIAHNFIFEIDAFGNVLQQSNVVYGRQPLPGNEPEQEDIHIVYTEHQFTNAIGDSAEYRAPQPYFVQSYEISGLPAPVGYYQWEDLKNDCATAAFIDFNIIPTTGIQKRLLKFSRVQYRGNDGTTTLPFGKIESKGLSHQSYQASFNQNMLAVFSPKIAPSDLQVILQDPTRGAYSFSDNYYWAVSGIKNYDPDHFFLSTLYTDPFGNKITLSYDPNYLLFIQKATDALGNETSVGKFNYRVLAPYVLQDINDNLAAARFDELGLVVKTFSIGKKGIDAGDKFDDTKTEIKDAVDFPGSEMEYDIFEWYNQTLATGFDLTNYKPRPNSVKTTIRETHYLADPQHLSRSRESYAYSDGSGQVVLTKAQAEPGAALQINPDGTMTAIANTSPNLRWAGNGRTILNNKGNPVKKYEPYFSVDPSFDDEKEMVELGVTPVMHYDPPGRVIRTDLPDKTFTKVEFTPWLQVSYDNNDTVKDSEWYAALGKPDPSDPEPADAEKRAAWLAARDSDTPSIVRLDSLGRSFLTIADNATEKLSSRSILDITGNPLEAADPLERQVVAYAYNMTGIKWKQTSMDAGSRWMMGDVAGRPLLGWDDRDHAWRYTYDALGRKEKTFVKEGNLGEIVTAQIEYGENVATAKTDNIKGKPYKNYDQSGISITLQFDFKGNPLQATKQFAKNYKTSLDWANPVDMEPDIFQNTVEYDALNRPIRLFTPHSATMSPSEITPGYNEAGLLDTVTVNIRGSATSTPFVTKISYDANGQREAIFYGNNTVTRYTHQKETLRLVRLLTTRNGGADILQDLNYTYDPVGNITQIMDNAQTDIFYDGQQVQALNKYIYDAVYRLVSATGRKQAGQTDIQQGSGISGNTFFRGYPFIGSSSISPNDANAFRNYTEQYAYDKAGNMLQQQHVAKNSSWTRNFTYDAGNNGNNRLTDVTLGADSFHYSYDAHGNMSGLETVLSELWDFSDRFKQADLGGGGTVYYVYDGAGQRCRKIIERQDGTSNERIYLGGIEIYQQKTSAGSVTLERETLHVMDAQRRIAMVDTPVVKLAGSNEVQLIRYNYDNHLGSASLELDDVANIISYEEYFPYGTTSYSTLDATREVPAKRYRYTGKERDEESGLNYHGARYYALWLCRWTAADPIGIGDGLNIYTYVSDNPVKLSDPGGTDGLPPQKYGYEEKKFDNFDQCVNNTWTGCTPVDGQSFSNGPYYGVVPRAAPSAQIATPPPPPPPAQKKPPAPKKPPEEKKGRELSISELTDLAEALGPHYTYPKEYYWVTGGLQLIGSGFEIAGGLYATPESLGGGLFIAGNGLDNGIAAFRTIKNGKPVFDFKYQLSSSIAASAGADPKLANVFGQMGDLYGNLAAAGVGYKLSLTSVTITEGEPYQVLFYHGNVAGREIVTVDTPAGPTAFYKRTGGGGISAGGAQPGDWAQFDGFASETGIFEYNGNYYKIDKPGWFVKHRYAAGLSEEDPLYRFGTPVQRDISDFLKTQNLPLGGPRVPWQTVQPELEFFGVQTIDPIPRYGAVNLKF